MVLGRGRRSTGSDEVEGFHRLKVIASGGFSTVFLAVDEQFDRTVALKILTVEVHDDSIRARFESECKSLGRLDGTPGIVTVHDGSITPSGTPWLAMGYYPAGSLADQLRRTGTLEAAAVARIGALLSSALQAAHAAGLVHADVKPGNVLLTDEGTPVLSDFGISRLATAPAISGEDALTLEYSSPERLKGADPTVANDVYALGATLYELLAGRPPFIPDPGESLPTFALRVATDPVPQIPRGDVPDSLSRGIDRALAKSPQDRWDSAGALGRALVVPGEQGPTLQPSAPAAPVAEPTVASPRPPVAPLGPVIAPIAPILASPPAIEDRPTVVRDKPPTPVEQKTGGKTRTRLWAAIAAVPIVVLAVLVVAHLSSKPGPKTPPLTAPAHPVAPQVTGATFTDRNLVVSWTEQTPGDPFLLQVYEPPKVDPTFTTIVDPSQRSYPVTKLDPTGNYCVRVSLIAPPDHRLDSSVYCTNTRSASSTTSSPKP